LGLTVSGEIIYSSLLPSKEKQSESLPFKLVRDRIRRMEKAEIKQIGEKL
jgi:hypothetical protein